MGICNWTSGRYSHESIISTKELYEKILERKAKNVAVTEK